MYFPILRGKQYELIALRELVGSIDRALVTPVIEPVRGNFSPLIRTIGELSDAGIKPVLILNPSVGELVGESERIRDALMMGGLSGKFTPCVKIKDGDDDRGVSIYDGLGEPAAIFIENGFGRSLIPLLNSSIFAFINEKASSPAAISSLTKAVLYGDFFNKQLRNADYGDKSPFSSLHVTYRNQKNVIGFGDYTILGEEYSESGGPAYVVAIHLSYIDPDEFDAMYVRHFSSFDDGLPTNPGGKFLDALSKLVLYVKENRGLFYSTSGLEEFFSIFNEMHFPGLGKIKKISIKHHIETTCAFIEGRNDV